MHGKTGFVLIGGSEMLIFNGVWLDKPILNCTV